MTEYQEEVLTNLLGLQAELRGDESEPHDEKASATADGATADTEAADTVTVTEQGMAVSVSSGPAPVVPVNERLVALNERLARLEFELAGVTKRIERMEPDPWMETAANVDADPDAPWRSFLDLQRIVADRLDQS